MVVLIVGAVNPTRTSPLPICLRPEQARFGELMKSGGVLVD